MANTEFQNNLSEAFNPLSQGLTQRVNASQCFISSLQTIHSTVVCVHVSVDSLLSLFDTGTHTTVLYGDAHYCSIRGRTLLYYVDCLQPHPGVAPILI